jgi:hypothetical protein
MLTKMMNWLTRSNRTETREVLGASADYWITTDCVKDPVSVSGVDEVYVIVNRKTGLTEGRFGQLPGAWHALQGIQGALDEVTGKHASKQ